MEENKINCDHACKNTCEKKLTLTHDFGEAIPSGQSWEFREKPNRVINRFTCAPLA